MPYELKNVLKALEEFGTTFEAAADEPITLRTAGEEAPVPSAVTQPALAKVLNEDDRYFLQRSLMSMDSQELQHLFYLQLGSKKANAIPLAQWAFSSGNRGLAEWAGNDPYIQNVLDISGGSALVRQDLDPILYPLFVKAFPGYDRFPKVPANGAVHAWRQISSYGDAAFMPDLGTVTDDTAVYTPQTTNIAIQNTRRGVSFKEQFAVAAGGMSWNPQNLELQNGMTAMAHKTQKTIFQGNASVSGGTASTEDGAYDANGFTGLRKILNLSPDTAVNFSPYLTSSPDNFVAAFGTASTTITDAVGVPPTVIYCRAKEGQQFADQQTSIQRTVDRTEFVPGVRVPAVMTNQGELPLVTIPGDSIGHYTASTFSNKDVADLYMLNEPTIVLPFLGAPGPTVIEIPPGVNGQLTRMFIIYFMVGLAALTTVNSVKLRANQSTT
jgi:hypothetical protein